MPASPSGGRVINIASGVTSSAVPGSSLYPGAKAFIDQLTRVAALEFAGRRITVNAVGPGSTATGPFADLPAGRLAETGAAAFLLGRVGIPADTAALVAFLATDEASFITGQVSYNTGGPARPPSAAPAELKLRPGDQPSRITSDLVLRVKPWGFETAAGTRGSLDKVIAQA
jgi:NAD(P)-dependent dehydrogenase (short-subunit alcohol dehydrogenase family)